MNDHGATVTPSPTVDGVTFDLATCDYRSFDDDYGVPLLTTVGKPRQGPLASATAVNTIAPYGIFNIKPALPEPEFRRRYLIRLAEKADQIDATLHSLAAEHDRRLVVLCWCKVTHLDDFCHRLMFRRWAEERYGLEVPELALHAPKAGGKPVMKDQLGLFDA